MQSLRWRVAVVNLGPVGAYVPNTRMADGYEPPSASLNPNAQPSAIEVCADVTDEDLTWLQERALGRRVEREAPKVDITPDPRLSQIVQR